VQQILSQDRDTGATLSDCRSRAIPVAELLPAATSAGGGGSVSCCIRHLLVLEMLASRMGPGALTSQRMSWGRAFFYCLLLGRAPAQQPAPQLGASDPQQLAQEQGYIQVCCNCCWKPQSQDSMRWLPHVNHLKDCVLRLRLAAQPVRLQQHMPAQAGCAAVQLQLPCASLMRCCIAYVAAYYKHSQVAVRNGVHALPVAPGRCDRIAFAVVKSVDVHIVCKCR
jgi:hypothetical protein